jgi:hypothetical protein
VVTNAWGLPVLLDDLIGVSSNMVKDAPIFAMVVAE